MEDSDFVFTAEEFEGCRLIRAVIPRIITMPTLSVAVAWYLSLWETDLPIVVLNDATRLRALPEAVRPVLLALVKRNALQSGFVASVWFTGENDLLQGQLRELFAEGGRGPGSVVTSEEDALEYLRRKIESRDAGAV